jgi:hypothetical protein
MEGSDYNLYSYMAICWRPKVSRGRSGPEARRSAVRTVRGGGVDGPRVRRVS